MVCCVLSACQNRVSPSPQLIATGYSTEQGVFRLWRKDLPQQQILLSVYTPYNGDNETVTTYDYQDGVLRRLESTQEGHDAQKVVLRFTAQGEATFVERIHNGQRDPLPSEIIMHYQQQADRFRQQSFSLQQKEIHLQQGEWYNGKLVDCEENSVKTEINAEIPQRLLLLGSSTSPRLGVAWLDTPHGQDLLLIADENLCRRQPTYDDLN